jgi:Ni/Fe-hydrogenase subunit HybB-like protein
MSRRKIYLKTVLWVFVGILATVTGARFLRGLGATTGLTDATPWGLWIAFDVMSGVALAAGGFVVAGLVYIFGREKYRPFARPAILTAFLGYIAVAIGLLYDLGIPLHIWHPVVYPQPHSVLFEVGMCVILYLTVLFLEFCPVILEHSWFDRPLFRAVHRFLKRLAIPLVIAGIVLSTLHQSSLGSLFLIAPYRVHPLWYSPIIWILFFVSAVGLGLMTVTAESFFSSWYFRHKLRLDLLAGFGKTASAVLFIYLGTRLVDLAVRGSLPLALDGSWQSNIFLLEIGLALIPAILLLFKRLRGSAPGLLLCAVMTLFSMIGYRFNVSIVAFSRPEGMSYFPSLIEVVVTLGIISSAMLVYLFIVEHFDVCPTDEPEEEQEVVRTRSIPSAQVSMRSLLPESLAGVRRYSLAALLGAAAAFALLSEDVRSGALLLQTPVSPARIVESFASADTDQWATRDSIPYPYSSNSESTNVFVIDGNQNGRLVLFDHDHHAKRAGGDNHCGLCHHQDLPFHKNTSCYQCHRDMYLSTDIFNHSSHVARIGGNEACTECHREPEAVKSRASARACADCHSESSVPDPIIRVAPEDKTGLAVGYMDAMHELCLRCHERQVQREPDSFHRSFAECAHCHRDFDLSILQELEPYNQLSLRY